MGFWEEHAPSRLPSYEASGELASGWLVRAVSEHLGALLLCLRGRSKLGTIRKALEGHCAIEYVFFSYLDCSLLCGND